MTDIQEQFRQTLADGIATACKVLETKYPDLTFPELSHFVGLAMLEFLDDYDTYLAEFADVTPQLEHTLSLTLDEYVAARSLGTCMDLTWPEGTTAEAQTYEEVMAAAARLRELMTPCSSEDVEKSNGLMVSGFDSVPDFEVEIIKVEAKSRKLNSSYPTVTVTQFDNTGHFMPKENLLDKIKVSSR